MAYSVPLAAKKTDLCVVGILFPEAFVLRSVPSTMGLTEILRGGVLSSEWFHVPQLSASCHLFPPRICPAVCGLAL